MFNRLNIYFIVITLLTGIFNYCSAQTSKVSWSTFSMGYGAPKSATTSVRTVLGEAFVGHQKTSNSAITSGFLAWFLKDTSTLRYTLVYPGDANNDGVVDARDILPIGRFYTQDGYPRVGASLQWTPQSVQVWDPYEEASYADCNGDATVLGNDVDAIITNWRKKVGSSENPSVDRVALCRQLLEGIDQQTPTPALKDIRSAIVAYMKNNLGINFDFSLKQNFPNPFNPSTTIRFSVPDYIPQVRVIIYDIVGQSVWEKTVDDVQAGEHEVIWNGENSSGFITASGIYFYRIFAGDNVAVKRMMLLK